MTTPDLGPLPKSDSNAALQRASFSAVSELLKTKGDLLVFRDERAEDAGVDASLEVVHDGAYTNCRSQLQLKGTDDASVNADGSFSLSIDVTNLNYLLEGPSPIYVVYLRERDEVRYAWARDEVVRISQANPDWQQQKTVTIRFVDRVTPAELDKIASRILDESRLTRAINDRLARSTISSPLRLTIDPKAPAVLDPAEAYEQLRRAGCALVAAGHPIVVVEMAKNLDRKQDSDPEIQLALAYAHYTRAEYQLALGHLSRSSLDAQSLSPTSALFLDMLRDAVQFAGGLITLEDVRQRQSVRASRLSPDDRLLLQFEELRHEVLHRTSSGEFGANYARLVSVFDAIQASNCSPAQKLQVSVSRLFVDCAKIGADFIRAVYSVRMRREVGWPITGADEQVAVECQGRFTSWEVAVADAVKQAVEIQHPILLADALLTRAYGRLGFASHVQIIGRTVGETVEAPDVVRTAVSDDLGRAKQIYIEAGNLEGELRCDMLMVDLLVFLGDGEKAKEMASRVLPQAEAMNYANLASQARECIDNRHRSQVWRAEFQRVSEADQDELLAQESDETISAFASTIISVFGIDPARQATVERVTRAGRMMAQERLNWCRHLSLLEQLDHTRTRETLYREDPNRRCYCELHQHQSAFPHTDAEAVVHAFKSTFCASCGDRNPKSPS